MRDVWEPAVYRRFEAERAQPFHDLVALVRGPTPRLVDLGCGTGALTRGAVLRLGATEALGIDRSEAMLREAAAHALPDRLEFVEGDLATWTSAGDVDLVLSNAALHWAPDHAAILARWTAALAPRGQLAVQMPCNARHPASTIAVEVAHEEPFLSAFGAAGPPPDAVQANVLSPVEYARILFDLGYDEQSVRLQVYAHVLPERRSVVDWVRGTTLTRFRSALPDELYERFVERYEQRLLEVLEDRERRAKRGVAVAAGGSPLGRAAGGGVDDRRPFLFTFERILFWARRP